MLSSTGEENTNYIKATISLNKFSPISSKSSSSSSSSSSSPSSHLHTQTHRFKTMEEVWKDINLASLHDHSAREAISVNPNPRNPHFILQDFFARPLSQDPSTNRSVISTNAESTLYGSPVPPPATVLSLNSGPGFDFLDNSDPLRSNRRLQSCTISNLSTTFDCPFEALASSSTLASFGNKRVQESDNSSCNRRHKRMIKNRESAARSRARKQAYTSELELEVAQLMEENARLKRQQEQLRVVAAAQVSKKRTLQRASTAPF